MSSGKLGKNKRAAASSLEKPVYVVEKLCEADIDDVEENEQDIQEIMKLTQCDRDVAERKLEEFGSVMAVVRDFTQPTNAELGNSEDSSVNQLIYKSIRHKLPVVPFGGGVAGGGAAEAEN